MTRISFHPKMHQTCLRVGGSRSDSGPWGKFRAWAVWPDNEPLAAGGLFRKRLNPPVWQRTDRLRMEGAYARRPNVVTKKKKVNWEGVREEAVMAESVPENSEEATAEQGGRDGLGIGLSGRPICQIKAPKKSGRRTKLRLAWEISVSPLKIFLKRLESQLRKIQNIHPERPGCAPCLSSPCPWSSVYRNDGEPKWPRHSRPSPRLALSPSGARPALPPDRKQKKKQCQSADEPSVQQTWRGMTVLCVRTAGKNNSSTHRARAGKRGCHGGSQQCVPHGTARRRAAPPHPEPLFFYLTPHTHNSCICIC